MEVIEKEAFFDHFLMLLRYVLHALKMEENSMKIKTSATLDKSSEEVFDCLTSIKFIQSLNQSFILEEEEGVSGMQQMVEKGVSVGTKFLQRSESELHPIIATMEVTEYIRPRIFTLTITRGRSTTYIKWRLKSIQHSTRVTFVLESLPQGRLERALGFISNFAFSDPKGNSHHYIQSLKQYIENQC